jgi:hypothetical protein
MTEACVHFNNLVACPTGGAEAAHVGVHQPGDSPASMRYGRWWIGSGNLGQRQRYKTVRPKAAPPAPFGMDGASGAPTGTAGRQNFPSGTGRRRYCHLEQKSSGPASGIAKTDALCLELVSRRSRQTHSRRAWILIPGLLPQLSIIDGKPVSRGSADHCGFAVSGKTGLTRFVALF